MIFFAVLMPVFFMSFLVVPIYIGMCGSVYFYYGRTIEQMKEYAYDPNYILGIHEGFVKYWQDNTDYVTFMEFILPIYGPVLFGVIVSFVLIYMFASYVKGVFVLH